MIENVKSGINTAFKGINPLYLTKNREIKIEDNKKQVKDTAHIREQIIDVLPAVFGVTSGGAVGVISYKKNEKGLLDKAEETILQKKDELTQNYLNSDEYKLFEKEIQLADNDLAFCKQDLEKFLKDNSENLADETIGKVAEGKRRIVYCQETIYSGIKSLELTRKRSVVDIPLFDFKESVKEEALNKAKEFKKVAIPAGIIAGAAIGALTYIGVHHSKNSD